MYNLNNFRKACFIEKDPCVPEIVKANITMFLQNKTPNWPLEKRSYEAYMQVEITSADERIEEVWQAVQACEHIWCVTQMGEDSAAIVFEMLRRAVIHQLKHKTVFILGDEAQMRYRLEMERPGALGLIKKLEIENDIEFVYWDTLFSFRITTPTIVVVPA